MQSVQKNKLMEGWLGLSNWQKILLALLVILLLASAIKAIYYTTQFGGADLRERIVGARALHTNQSPYYYKWSPGDPEELINPNLNQSRNISGLSVAPGTLYILYLFSPLKYSLLRFAWLAFQYLLLGYSFFYFLKQSWQSDTSRLFVALFGTTFFFCSPFWLLHIDRGQVYILYAFIFCLLYQCLQSLQKSMHFVAGVLIIAGIYLRPTFAVVALPLLFCLKKEVWIGMVTAAAIAILFLFLNFSLWKDYFTAMGAFTQIIPGLEFATSKPVVYPAVIEGMNNLRSGKIDFMCGGLRPLDVWMAKAGINLPGKIYIFIYTGIVTLLAILFKSKLRRFDAVVFSLFGFLCYMISEYIMPAPRGAYTLVQWIFPVLLILSTNKATPMHKLVMGVGLCFMCAFPFYFPLLYDVGELLLVFSVISFLRTYRIEEKITD